jgi:hypothetical protein
MSCLFRSIGLHVGKATHDVRADICDYMEAHITDTLMGLSIGEWICMSAEMDCPNCPLALHVEAMKYIVNMRRSVIWGGGIEIAIACQVYNRNIVVCDMPHTEVVAEFLVMVPTLHHPIHLGWNGYHYEPMMQRYYPTVL